MCFKVFLNTAYVISPANLIPLVFVLGFYNTCIFGGVFKCFSVTADPALSSSVQLD